MNAQTRSEVICLCGLLWALTASVGICGCAPAGRSAAVQIPAMLNRQAAAWNAGDIEGFMAPYWHSEQLSFTSGGKTTRGWQETLEGYRRRYPTREAMGVLTFTDLEVRPLGRQAALVMGRWHLDRKEPIGGRFTLVCQQRGGHWVIIHDHTSTDAP